LKLELELELEHTHHGGWVFKLKLGLCALELGLVAPDAEAVPHQLLHEGLQ